MKPYSNSSKPTFKCVGERPPAPPSARDQFEWSHSKCTGSIEFSWHWNQLQGTSENTICTKPLAQVKGSQVGTSGAGRPGIRPEKTGLRLDQVGLDAHEVLESRLRVRDLLERLLQAPA